ncbi:STAS domain-containing protein [Chitinibacter tainanensis]|uniref:STAS domain-containing protein n=1 Tax=Chitinibacter tainanensis TaxID=230667 RepID=UPI0003F91B5F|nr:STAS domain-containing protein [Chitinibacter tainanensis]
MTHTIQLLGEQTIYQARQTHTQLWQALHEHNEPLQLELAGVTEVDSSLVQILLWLVPEAKRLGRPLTMGEPSAVLAEVLAVLGLSAILQSEGAGHE